MPITTFIFFITDTIFLAKVVPPNKIIPWRSKASEKPCREVFQLSTHIRISLNAFFITNH